MITKRASDTVKKSNVSNLEERENRVNDIEWIAIVVEEQWKLLDEW